MPWTVYSGRSRAMYALGYILRILPAFMCSYGLMRFICCSLALTEYIYILPPVCLVCCMLFSAMICSKKALAVGTALIAAAAAYFILSTKNIVGVLYGFVLVFTNAWHQRLSALGFGTSASASPHIAGMCEELGCTETIFNVAAIALLCMLITLFSVIFTLKRARILPILILGASLSTVIHYFGMCDDNLSFALMLASLAGIISLWHHDRIFANRKAHSTALGISEASDTSRAELEHNVKLGTALGGFSGTFAALCALMLLIFPMQTDTPMADIPAISVPAHAVEKRVSAMITGRNPSPSGIFYSGNSNKLSKNAGAQPITMTGKKLLSVESAVDIPIYLRAWTGTYYRNDTWYTASQKQISEYREIFGEGFSPELLTYELLFALDPELVTLPDGAAFSDHTDFGYITLPIHIKKMGYSADDIILPSYTDQLSGFMKYGTSEPHWHRYSNYCDGIFDSGNFSSVDAYSVLAFAGTEPTDETARNIGMLVNYYAEQYDIIRSLRKLANEGASEEKIRAEYDKAASQTPYSADPYTHKPVRTTASGKYTFPDESLSYRYAYKMDGDERRRVNAMIDNLSLYYNYVYENYLGTCEGFRYFEDLALDIASDAGIDLRRDSFSFVGRHRIAEAIIEYMSENTEYTLSPRTPSPGRTYLNAAETFLFDTEEGYCVQYATSAVMLLRAAGIPARYADGYIAGDFKKSDSAYISEVTDRNAHAWIEVYYDYYGWVVYEATKPYVIEREAAAAPTLPDTLPQSPETRLPPPDTQSPVPDAQKPNVNTGSTAHQKNSDSEKEYGGIVNPTAILVTCVILFVCGGTIIAATLIRSSRTRHIKRRDELIELAEHGKITSDRTKEYTENIGDLIMYILKKEGLTPKDSELSRTFARRVDERFEKVLGKSFIPVAESIQRGEFSENAPPGDLEITAQYLKALVHGTKSGAGAYLRR